MNTYLLAFVSSALFSLFLTRAVRDFAIRRGWVDEPDADRKRQRTDCTFMAPYGPGE